MKKVLLTLVAAFLSVAAMAQTCPNPNGFSALDGAKGTKGATKDAAPTWQSIHTPFSTTDINGNPVNVADTLAAGKCIVIDYSATWCNPCYRFHQSKNLEAIHNQLGSSVCVLWVEADNSTTLADIQGTGNNTQGDWTHYNDGSAVSYRIIDCASCESMIDPTGYVPAVYFIAPNGYYCHIYGETWGLSISMTNAEAVANIQALVASYPRAGEAPTSLTLSGPDVAFVGTPVTFSASYASVDDVTANSWTFTGGTPASASGLTATTTYNTPGTYTVEFNVTNTSGSAQASKTITVRDGWDFGDEMDYTMGTAYESALGLSSGSEFEWGVLYPASLMAGRNYLVNVSAYMNITGTYTVRAYQGGTESPTTLIYEHAYTINQTDRYVNMPINEVVALDPSKSLWITLSARGYAATYTSYDGDPNSSLLTLNNNWYTMADATGGSYEGTWMIKTTTSATVGIDNAEAMNVSVHPSPVTDKLYISEEVNEVSIIDMGGRTIITEKNTNVVDMSHLSTGVYMVRLVTDNGIATKKVVKE